MITLNEEIEWVHQVVHYIHLHASFIQHNKKDSETKKETWTEIWNNFERLKI